MSLEAFSTAPSPEDFRALEEYQASTPATFFDGKPVLHYTNDHCTAQISEADSSGRCSAIGDLFLRGVQGGGGPPTTTPPSSNGTTTTTTTAAATNGCDATGPPPGPSGPVSIWVTSKAFTIYSATAGKGVHIPYPMISLHAQQRDGLYMQLVLNSGTGVADDDELDVLELTVTPSSSSAHDSMNNGGGDDGPGSATPAPGLPGSEIERLFKAVSDCADLHPDPDEDEEREQGARGVMGMLGGLGGGDLDLSGGGWITAENMHEHVDGEGNVVFPGGGGGGDGDGEGEVGRGPLGPGAGIRRAAEGEDGNGGDEEGEDTKWRRTE